MLYFLSVHRWIQNIAIISFKGAYHVNKLEGYWSLQCHKTETPLLPTLSCSASWQGLEEPVSFQITQTRDPLNTPHTDVNSSILQAQYIEKWTSSQYRKTAIFNNYIIVYLKDWLSDSSIYSLQWACKPTSRCIEINIKFEKELHFSFKIYEI